MCSVFKIYFTKILLYFKHFTLLQYLFSSNVHKNQKCSFRCNDNNYSYVGKICLYFFLMGRSRTFLNKDQISSGQDKGKG